MVTIQLLRIEPRRNPGIPGHGEFTKLSIETFPISILTQIIINKVDRTGDIYFTDPIDAKWRIYPEGEKVILEPVV